jgi:hypothetical protein
MSRKSPSQTDQARGSRIAVLCAIIVAITAFLLILFVFNNNSMTSVTNDQTTTLMGNIWSKDNTLGFEAQVVYVLHPEIASCPTSPCELSPVYMIKVISEKDAFLLGYRVCNNNTGNCIAQDNIAIHTLNAQRILFQSGIHGWNPGDSIHIQLKVAPSIQAADTPKNSSDEPSIPNFGPDATRTG